MLKIGLAFAGADGAYQFGVWKAMKQEGVENRITAVSGASAGVLNAAFFLKGDDEIARYIWEQFPETLTLETMADMIDKYIDMGIFDDKKNCYIGSKVKREILYFCMKELPIEDRREKMLDNSAWDSVLLEPFYAQEKCDIIIAVHPGVDMDISYNLNRYRNTQIVEFMPEDFDGEADAKKRIERGYQDSLNFFINMKQKLNSEVESLLRVESADDRKKVYQKIRQRREDEHF